MDQRQLRLDRIFDWMRLFREFSRLCAPEMKKLVRARRSATNPDLITDRRIIDYRCCVLSTNCLWDSMSGTYNVTRASNNWTAFVRSVAKIVERLDAGNLACLREENRREYEVGPSLLGVLLQRENRSYKGRCIFVVRTYIFKIVLS